MTFAKSAVVFVFSFFFLLAQGQTVLDTQVARSSNIEYQVVLPKNDPRVLVMLLHGLGGDAGFFKTSEFQRQLAPYLNKGYLFVIPEGLDSKPSEILSDKPYRAWNGGDPIYKSSDDCCFGLYTRFENFNRFRGGQTLLNEPPVPDDIERLRFKLAEFQKKFNIPNKKTALIGISNGAIMAYRLQCNLKPGVLQSLVAIQGSLSGFAECGTGAAQNMLHIHGDADQVVPFSGGKTWIAPLYPEFYFQRSPLQSFGLLAKATNCRFGNKGEDAKSVVGKSRPVMDSPETAWIKYEARCAEKNRRYHFVVYRGAGHEYRMSMFLLGMSFIAKYTDVRNVKK